MKPVTCGEEIQSNKPAPGDVAGGNLILCQTYEKANVDSGGGGFRLLAVDGSPAEAGQGKHAQGKHHAKHHHGKHHPKN